MGCNCHSPGAARRAGLIQARQPQLIERTDCNVSPGEVAPGETITATVTYENRRSRSVTYTVEVRARPVAGGAPLIGDIEDGAIPPGESTTHALTVEAPESEGVYEIATKVTDEEETGFTPI